MQKSPFYLNKRTLILAHGCTGDGRAEETHGQLGDPELDSSRELLAPIGWLGAEAAE